MSNLTRKCVKVNTRVHVGHCNLNGVMSKQLGNKLDLNEVLSVINSFDIFAVSETHHLPSNGKQIDNYMDFHSYRKPGKRVDYGSGDLSVYIKKNIARGISVIHAEVSDFMWVEMNKTFMGWAPIKPV